MSIFLMLMFVFKSCVKYFLKKYTTILFLCPGFQILTIRIYQCAIPYSVYNPV